MSEGRVQIAAFSDTICPYCYIGKRRIDQLAENFDFDIEWIPFEIHPETPAGGIPIERLAGVRLARLKHEVARIGEEVGLSFVYPPVLPNSRLSLELLEFAKEEGVADAHEALFAAYFREGRDIGDRAVLLDLAESMGIARESASAALGGGLYRGKVERGKELAAELGVTAVPTFFIGRAVVWGAQPLGTFERAMVKALLDASADGAAP